MSKIKLTKDYFDSLDKFIKNNSLDIPTEVVFDLFKTGTLSMAFLQYIKNLEKTSEDVGINEYFDKEFSYIVFLNALYLQKNVLITKFFLRSLRKRDRLKLIETYDLSNLETYIYNLLFTSAKEKKRLSTEQILLYVSKYKKYKITNREFFNSLIKKIRSRVRVQLQRQAEKEKRYLHGVESLR
ncbi:MAG: hypothetical protein QW478_15185 [Candidatus Micrarchaeaceae archaeon]